MREKEKERGKEAEKRWTGFPREKSVEVGRATGVSLSSRMTPSPAQTCALSRAASSVFGFQFKVFKKLMVDGSSGTRLVLRRVRCISSSDGIFNMALTRATTQPLPPTHTGETLFLDSRGGSHTSLQVRSSQPQHHLTTPLRSLMKPVN